MAFKQQPAGEKMSLVPNDFPDMPKPSRYDLHTADGRQQYEAALEEWWHQLKETLLQKLQRVADRK